MKQKTKLPVILLTGFLGSGKTTFLNRLLKQPGFSNSLVLINEFGAVSIDHHLVQESTETVFELSNGCVCCSIRSDLVEKLLEQDFSQFDRLIIETTGIADPLPIFQSLTADPRLSTQLLPATIASIVDASGSPGTINRYPEAQLQIAAADHILFSKTDISPLQDDLRKMITSINPTARIGNATTGLRPDDFLLPPTTKLDTGSPNKRHDNYNSIVLETDRRLAATDFYGMLNLIVNRLGNSLVRIKGFGLLEETGNPVIVQVSGSVIHDPQPAPDGVALRTQLVVITSGNETAGALEIFNGFTGQPMYDVADREALLENPLAIPGSGT